MTHLETELEQLKKIILEMMTLVKNQLEKSKYTFLNNDTELAEEIIHNEKRVDAMELSIDRKCENIFALFQPVATNLRFVIAMLKINSDLERIGDYADGIAKYVVDLNEPIAKKALETTHIPEMFDIAISMITSIYTVFEQGDTSLSRKVYKKDMELNNINHNASKIITELIKEKTENIRPLLFLLSTIRKIERVGDHIKNIAEDVIFHLETEVLKHNK
jgi:phosphate transport system protein